MINLAIFASGSGTNAEQLILYLRKHSRISVKTIFCNNPAAGVLDRVKKWKKETVVFTRAEFQHPDFIHQLKSRNIDAIVLAGFLWKIPPYLIAQYPDLIVNIHPALLPGYGGKGMFGQFVHEAVIQNQEKESGITIHLVNENYDEGKILFQTQCDVKPNETPESLANKIHVLEHRFFPQIVEDYFTERLLVD